MTSRPGRGKSLTFFYSVVYNYKAKGGREDGIRWVLISDRGNRHVTILAFQTAVTFENQIFLINMENQNGAIAKSYMRKGFLMYEEMRIY